MKKLLFVSLLVCASAPAYAYTYQLQGLSVEDVLTIGRGLDKLPREDTDKNQLYMRIQQQITAQEAAWKKAQDQAKEDETKGKEVREKTDKSDKDKQGTAQ